MSRAANLPFERGTEDGLTDKERQILNLADAGLDRKKIAELTGLKPHRVKSIQGTFADSGRDPWKDAAAIGTAMLGDAITRMLARQHRQIGPVR